MLEHFIYHLEERTSIGIQKALENEHLREPWEWINARVMINLSLFFIGFFFRLTFLGIFMKFVLGISLLRNEIQIMLAAASVYLRYSFNYFTIVFIDA